MSDIKNSRHHCGKPRDKRRRASRGGYKSPMMSEKSDAELTSSPASSPALGPTASSQGGGSTRRPSCAGLLTPPPPDEAPPPRVQQLLLPQPEQPHVEMSVFRLTHTTRQVYPTQGSESQDRPPPPIAENEPPSPAASERSQCDASKQACLKETDNSAAVTRLDVAMSRLRKIYFGILEEQLLNEALLAAGSDAEEFSVTRGGSAYCCGDRLSPRTSLSSHETVSGGGGGGSDSGPCCVHCGAPAGRHNRVTQTSASDRALLLDVHLLPRLMHAYERNHALIVQDLREALARVEEAAGAGALDAEEATAANAGAAALAAALRSKTMAATQQQQPPPPPATLQPPLQPLPTRPDVCPKECSPARCPLASGSASSPAASPVLAPHKHSLPPSSSKDPTRRRRPPTWWRKLLCISTEDDG